MTLTTRLSLFFLAMLGLVLTGFSTTLYVLAAVYLHRQTEERLDAALNTLAAAAEVGPDGVEWDPSERRLAFDSGANGEPLLWLVSDDRGRVVDRSGQPDAEDFLVAAAQHLRAGERSTKRLDWQGERWQFRQRRMQPDNSEAAAALPQPAQNKDERVYPALTITAGVPLGPVRATLRQLAATLTGLSLAIWLVALFAGRAVCRRALRPVSRMAAAARDMDGADLGRRLPVAAAADELADLSRAFNGLLDRLQESFERQRRFTGDASHQLRTPLTALLGQIEVALRRPRGADEYRGTLASVQRQALHLRRIVEALLFLARADAEARLPDLEAVALDVWLEAYVRKYADHPRASDIVLERMAVGPLRAKVQPALLGELVNILVENACKYSPPGSPVTVRLAREGGEVLLSVEDRGWGIAEADLPHVCEPFFRSPDARRRGVTGLGLGLSIAQRLAEAFGGSLVATSQKGQGSRFTLKLRENGGPQ